MSRRLSGSLLAIASISACGFAFAAHPLVADDASTVGANHFELELGAERSASDTVTSFEGGVQLTYGLLSNLDLSVRPVWLAERAQSGTGSERGLGGTTALLKWHVFDVGMWSFALRGGAELPTGDASRNLGKNFVAWQGTAIASLKLERIAFDANFGYEQGVDDKLVLRYLPNGQFAARWLVSDTVQLVSEIGFERNPNGSGSTWPAAARLGIVATVARPLDVDIGYQGRLNHAAPRQVVLAGVTVRW
jgi:hypothetical protein